MKKDIKLKSRKLSFLEFTLTYIILLTLGAGQLLILLEYLHHEIIPSEFIWGMLGYWGIVSAIFTFVTINQKIKAYDVPMKKLSKAAQQVAHGDFSVYLKPEHTADKFDYIDIMFEDFNKMVEELSSIETLKNDFIANVSHEIKTPLSVIQSYAIAMQKMDLPREMYTDYANTIVSASKNLSIMVTNILKLNKLINQEIPTVIEKYDLCIQLCDCAFAFEGVWEEKGIEFVADLDERVIVCYEPGILEIVWNNLLSNALKFTKSGGTVTLKQTSDTEYITVSVSDTGCGMTPKTMKHIFEKFYQGDSSHSGEGNGLGLALSFHAIQIAGGSISVESEPNRGSSFTVKLKKKNCILDY